MTPVDEARTCYRVNACPFRHSYEPDKDISFTKLEWAWIKYLHHQWVARGRECPGCGPLVFEARDIGN